MRLLNGVEGLELNGPELEVWAKANVLFSNSHVLRGEDLECVAEEHTAPVEDEDSDARRIPLAELPGAYDKLDEFVANHEELLQSGLLNANRLRRTRGRESDLVPADSADMETAADLKEMIGSKIYPDQSANDTSA
ncbi:MAG TPA: hypothetical protein VFX79_02090 [Candidatus Saccharimonadales bacterium]|nr:hypothetical protein [Candidatus Saccharimonadales bacterium]